jgi:hypothetical protein
VPILNDGRLKGYVVPLSVDTTALRAVRASSLSFDGEMDVGSDTRQKADLDMLSLGCCLFNSMLVVVAR